MQPPGRVLITKLVEYMEGEILEAVSDRLSDGQGVEFLKSFNNALVVDDAAVDGEKGGLFGTGWFAREELSGVDAAAKKVMDEWQVPDWRGGDAAAAQRFLGGLITDLEKMNLAVDELQAELAQLEVPSDAPEAQELRTLINQLEGKERELEALVTEIKRYASMGGSYTNSVAEAMEQDARNLQNTIHGIAKDIKKLSVT